MIHRLKRPPSGVEYLLWGVDTLHLGQMIFNQKPGKLSDLCLPRRRREGPIYEVEFSFLNPHLPLLLFLPEVKEDGMAVVEQTGCHPIPFEWLRNY